MWGRKKKTPDPPDRPDIPPASVAEYRLRLTEARRVLWWLAESERRNADESEDITRTIDAIDVTLSRPQPKE